MEGRFASPLFWAVMIGWILSVVLHEFAHGLVAYWGGDYTIRERGGLSLNPLQYVHPFYSIGLPMIFLAMGGLPLPGGVNYVRKDLLRSHLWDCAVSLAGPVMNLLLFALCALPLHPRFGWIHPLPGDALEGAPAVLATMAWLQLISVFFNLIPIPPLDGFQAIAAFMKDETRAKLLSPQVVIGGTVILFVVLFNSPVIVQRFYDAVHNVMAAVGFDDLTLEYFRQAVNSILFGAS
jgi:Zn-dependent protease